MSICNSRLNLYIKYIAYLLKNLNTREVFELFLTLLNKTKNNPSNIKAIIVN